MKILFIAPRYHTNQHDTITALIDAGNKVFFYSLYEDVGTCDYSNIKPNTIPLAKSFYLLAKLLNWDIITNKRNIRSKGYPSLKYLFALFKKIKPDLVIVRDLNITSFLSLTVARYLGVARLLYDQSPLHRPKKPLLKRMVFFLIELFFTGKLIRITVVAGNNKTENVTKNTHLLPFVIQTHDTKKLKNTETINILSVGKFQKRKNHILLLQAIEDEPVNLTIIGNAYTESQRKHLAEIEQYINDKDLNKKVSIIQNVPYKEMGLYYKNCDIFILPSKLEQFGVSILEAMSYGKPVICSNDAGVRHCVTNKSNGIIFIKNDIDSLKEAINYLLSPEIDLEEMGKQSLIHIEKCHNSKIYMNNLKMILKKHYPKTEKKLQCNL